jgi:hypothetical protein
MANIKFSDFTVGNTEGDIDFVVGYKGANNIQISPTNLLASALGNYLPLAGGRMTGNVIFNDNVQGLFGTGSDLKVFHDGSASSIDNYTGSLNIREFAADGDIIFSADNGSGGGNITEYFRLDGGAVKTIASKNFAFLDSIKAEFGDSGDLQIYHNATNSLIENSTGHLYIKNSGVDKDIIFEGDNGSGGVTEYFKLDGSDVETVFSIRAKFIDNTRLNIGSSRDLVLFHNGTDSFIINETGNLKITQGADNADIIFECDNGSGGTETYFFLDGSASSGNPFTVFPDNAELAFGDGRDFRIKHTGSTYLSNAVGDLYFRQQADDSDMIFQCDDGSGGVTEYFKLDGSRASGAYTYTIRPDGGVITFGDGLDLRLWHDPNTGLSYMRSYNNNLYIEAITADTDILFRADNGSGGVENYIQIDGSEGRTTFNKTIRLNDAIAAQFGGSNGMQIYHNNSNSVIQNITGNLTIRNDANDKDIEFACDDGAGGVTTYLTLDGSLGFTTAQKQIAFQDNVKATFGQGDDLQIYHSGASSSIRNQTGDLYIQNFADDSDIVFQSDDGSGGVATYFYLDGGNTFTNFQLNARWVDNAKAQFGNSGDLQIYHDGSHSYIQDTGTGVLKILGSGVTIQNAAGSENMAVFTENDTVILYNNGVEKLRTIGSGIKISGVSEYADNTAAIAGGLTTGDVYRTGDLLKIVH